MTNSGDTTVVQFLSAVGAMNASLADFARALRERPEFRHVRRDMDVRIDQSGPVLEAYVDTERRDGIGMTWWLDVRTEGGRWVIDARVTTTGTGGQDTLVDVPRRVADTVDDLLSAIASTTRDLVARNTVPALGSFG